MYCTGYTYQVRKPLLAVQVLHHSLTHIVYIYNFNTQYIKYVQYICHMYMKIKLQAHNTLQNDGMLDSCICIELRVLMLYLSFLVFTIHGQANTDVVITSFIDAIIINISSSLLMLLLFLVYFIYCVF